MQHISATRRSGTANVFPYIFQIPTSIVTPGGVPASAIGHSVANYSGHILKLVPGDHQYAFPLFPIVIIWNGHSKFTPTQFLKSTSVRDWKLGILNRHLNEAVKLFEEVEGDLNRQENPLLFESFHELRSQVHLTGQILGDRIAGRSQTIPPVSYGPRAGTTSDLTYPFPKNYVPTPFLRHEVDPNIGAPVYPEDLPPKTTQQPVAPPSSSLTTGRIFVGFTPDPLWRDFTEDFYLPLDIPMALPMDPSQPLPSQIFRSQQSQSQIVTTQTQPSSSQIDPSQPLFSQIDDPSQPSSSQTVPLQAVPLIPQVTINPPRPTLSARKSAPSATVTSSSVPPPPAPPSSAPPQPPTSSSSTISTISSTPSLHPAKSATSSSVRSKRFNCNFCKYSTDRKNDWDNHCNTHTGVRFKCGSCERDFASEKNRTIHFRQIHLKQHRALCSVDKCNFSCNDFGVLKVHQYDEHGIGKEARCLKCQKKFNNYRVFERHIKLCQLPKDKECPFCKKSYKSTERLIGHMDTVHKGKPRLICEQCGKVFISKDSLRVHKSNTHE